MVSNFFRKKPTTHQTAPKVVLTAPKHSSSSSNLSLDDSWEMVSSTESTNSSASSSAGSITYIQFILNLDQRRLKTGSKLFVEKILNEKHLPKILFFTFTLSACSLQEHASKAEIKTFFKIEKSAEEKFLQIIFNKITQHFESSKIDNTTIVTTKSQNNLMSIAVNFTSLPVPGGISKTFQILIEFEGDKIKFFTLPIKFSLPEKAALNLARPFIEQDQFEKYICNFFPLFIECIYLGLTEEFSEKNELSFQVNLNYDFQ